LAPVGDAEGRQPYLTYDWLQMKVYRLDGDTRAEITGLSPQSHRLIRHFAELSRINNGSPVACTHAELIRMLWGQREEWPPNRVYDETNLRNVVTALRKRIERDPACPVLLQTERNIGYRLLIRVKSAET
jgi:DNA-binding response OmpR family regulator